MVYAYHFVGDTLRDGRPTPEVGEWLVHDGDVVLCQKGLHGSLDPFDALKYAPGPYLCLCAYDGDIIYGEDKLAASRRCIVAKVNFTEALRYYARRQALGVVHMWDAPQVVLDYLTTGDEGLRAAARGAVRDAAWAAAAAWGAARDAARDAVRDAAWAAALGAAKDAAWDAAWAAAKAAALAAAWDAALDAARSEFQQLVKKSFEEFPQAVTWTE